MSNDTASATSTRTQDHEMNGAANKNSNPDDPHGLHQLDARLRAIVAEELVRLRVKKIVDPEKRESVSRHPLMLALVATVVGALLTFGVAEFQNERDLTLERRTRAFAAIDSADAILARFEYQSTLVTNEIRSQDSGNLFLDSTLAAQSLPARKSAATTSMGDTRKAFGLLAAELGGRALSESSRICVLAGAEFANKYLSATVAAADLSRAVVGNAYYSRGLVEMQQKSYSARAVDFAYSTADAIRDGRIPTETDKDVKGCGEMQRSGGSLQARLDSLDASIKASNEELSKLFQRVK